ncbi:MAG: HAMP domain-containing histidine kinase [Ruminococcus sp.]|nr:HAMP domain-containing histidine kinase [Ruminococcus sp.]
MKLFKDYLYIHRKILLYGSLVVFIFLLTFWLYRLPLGAVLYPTALCVAVGVVFFAFDFFRFQKDRKSINEIKSVTDAMLSAIVQSPPKDHEDWAEAMRAVISAHDEFAMQTREKYSDMITYYTVWAHQIKTPIASMRLILSGEDSQLSRKASAELFRIEQYVDMVLAFLRLGSDTTDYVFSQHRLDEIVKQAVRKFRGEFIMRKLTLSLELSETVITTDEKWLSFIIEQVLSNALKYTKTGGITIKSTDDGKLTVSDTGIGILPQDLPRIFDNGYTGSNGRLDKSASGIGLYLCKRICKNLSHSISAVSQVGKGTSVTIDLSKSVPRD